MSPTSYQTAPPRGDGSLVWPFYITICNFEREEEQIITIIDSRIEPIFELRQSFIKSSNCRSEAGSSRQHPN